LPNELRASGYRVVRHDDHFPNPRTPDEVWIPEVASHGWIALSHNREIRRVAQQRDLVMRGGLALFMLIGKHHHEFQRNLMATMPVVLQFLEQHNGPFIAHVTRPDHHPIGSRAGYVRMALTLEQWRARHGGE
jgi:hypothetical protein